VGGDGKGPDPYDLLLSARRLYRNDLTMYARRKGWSLEGVQVTLTHEKIHAADCDECVAQEGKLDQIAKTIYLKVTLPRNSGNGSWKSRTGGPVNKNPYYECRVVGRLG